MTLNRAKLASGFELDFVDEGPRDAPALIFLHGFPESHRTWRHQIAHLKGRFRCVAPDQRGYRGSSKPQDVDSYTPDKLIGDVFELADALGIDKLGIIALTHPATRAGSSGDLAALPLPVDLTAFDLAPPK